VSEPSALPERSSPQHGDVVVTSELQPRVHYTVRQLPGIVQFSAPVREDAIRLARSFGEKYTVDVWCSENGSYRLLAAYRPQTSISASDRQAASCPGIERRRR
jgi:hypothetical protein